MSSIITTFIGTTHIAMAIPATDTAPEASVVWIAAVMLRSETKLSHITQ